MVKLGLDVDEALSRAGLPAHVLDDPETSLPYAIVTRFLEEAARLANRRTLGTEVGYATPIEALGVFGRCVANTATLGDAITRAQEIGPGYYSGEIFWATREEDSIYLCHRFPTRFDDPQQQAEQFSFGVVLRLLRSIDAPPWSPAIRLKRGMPHALADMPMLRDAAMTFDHSAWAVGFPMSLLHRSMPTPLGPAPTAEEILDWKAAAPSAGFGDGVAHVVRVVGRGGNVGMEQVAAWIRTSTRTLQRRLEDGGLSYARVLARVQFEAAVRLLDDETRSLQTVARELGYSDPAHFTRAFRRWTGSTPRTFRRLRANEMLLFARHPHLLAPSRDPLRGAVSAHH
jgi:AraC-like DNA-binding protein